MVYRHTEERCIEVATYMLENNTTVRAAAKHFSISKSTVHKDVTEKLKYIHPALHSEIMCLLAKNKAERHLRGGEATRNKYLRSNKKGA